MAKHIHRSTCRVLLIPACFVRSPVARLSPLKLLSNPVRTLLFIVHLISSVISPPSLLFYGVSITRQIIGSMKRDFLASGRQPAGVCCAALTLATRVNRIERSKDEIRKVRVHLSLSLSLSLCVCVGVFLHLCTAGCDVLGLLLIVVMTACRSRRVVRCRCSISRLFVCFHLRVSCRVLLLLRYRTLLGSVGRR